MYDEAIGTTPMGYPHALLRVSTPGNGGPYVCTMDSRNGTAVPGDFPALLSRSSHSLTAKLEAMSSKSGL